MWPWGVQILDCINQRDFSLAWVLGEWQVLGKLWAFRGLDPLAWSTGGRPRAPRAGARRHWSVCVFSYKTSPGRPSPWPGCRALGCYCRLLHSTLRGSHSWPLWTSVETEAQIGDVTDARPRSCQMAKAGFEPGSRARLSALEGGSLPARLEKRTCPAQADAVRPVVV